MDRNVALWVAVAAFAAGVSWKISAWFRGGLDPAARRIGAWSRAGAAIRGIASTVASARAVTLLRSLVLDVLLQRRLLRESAARWLAHMAMFVAFAALVLMHALGRVLTARIFPSYEPTLDPFLFLRALFGAVLLVGWAAASWRRLAARDPRRNTRPSDSYALAIVGLVLLSGVLLEAVKVGSWSRFRSMAMEYADPSEEAALAAYWTGQMGTVAPRPLAGGALAARGREIHEASCATCHSAPSSGFVGWALAAALRPAAPRLDAAGAPRLLWSVHFFACLVGLAYLPFSKMFHAVTAPLSLLSNAVVRRGKADPANVATKQMLELDACTHCCACSAHCSMAPASDVFGNAGVLPSEKISALRALASGRDLAPRQLRTLQQGVCLCTSCDRCTVACPSGIDLLGLWTSAKEALLARGEPEYSLLSPLSMRRALASDAIDPAAYRDAVERPRRAIAARSGAAALEDRAVALSPGDGRLWAALQGIPDAGTVGSCFGCKTCTTACPVVREHADPQQALGLLPHQIAYAARLGLSGLVLGSRMLWDCLGCYRCQELCPQGVGVTEVVYRLKNLAIAEAAREGARAGRSA
jgi:heterodisulfide reductase subunit C